VIRIETGALVASVSDVRALLQYYGIDDARADELLAIAKSGTEPWWDGYAALGQPLRKVLAYEDSASHIRQFQAVMIPCLLQTGDYARAAAEAYDVRESRLIELQVQVCLRRQELVRWDGGPELSFVVAEDAICRRVGSDEIMRTQLTHLLELTDRRRIDFRILPLAAGVCPEMTVSFMVFEFHSDDEDHVVSLADPHDHVLVRDDPETVSKYLEAFEVLKESSLSRCESTEILARLVEEVDRGR